jgi:glyoxylase-like metal-dependent hydrolase (beta-lactamase superfamily II)
MGEIIPGIYQLKIPMPINPLGYINAYLIREGNECVLVDTGWNTKEAFDALESQLAELGLPFKDISQIVITHIHPDHYGLAGRLKQLSGAQLALHQKERDLIDSRYVNVEQSLKDMARLLHVNGAPDIDLPGMQGASMEVIDLVSPMMPDLILHGGEIISIDSFNFEVLWTPGHSPGHISLYEPTRKILISGDHILPTITTIISLHVQSGPNPLRDYVNSLHAIQDLEVELVLPAHEHIFRNMQRRIEQLLLHHEERNNAIIDTIRSNEKSAYQISSLIPWGSSVLQLTWSKMTPLDKRMALTETLAHLEFMREQQKVERIAGGDVILYHAI